MSVIGDSNSAERGHISSRLSERIGRLSAEKRELLQAILLGNGIELSKEPAPLELHVTAREVYQGRSPWLVRQGKLQAPLSLSQHGIWLFETLYPSTSVFNICTVVSLQGNLRIDVLKRCFDEIVVRHEMLRTHFKEEEGVPIQVIEEPKPVQWVDVDLSKLARPDRSAACNQQVLSEAARPFDLCRGPLFRLKLLKLAEYEYQLVITVHHIVSDGWSQGVLIRELEALYAAFVAGRGSPLPALGVQYADYALWQRSWLQGEVLERQVGYWKERLKGAPPALSLPTDYPRPAVQSFRGASVSLVLPPALIDALQGVARSEGATLYMVLTAAFQLLLSRWSGQSDVVVGTPVAGRTHRETEGLIGFFVNMLALRADLSGDPPFRALLGSVRETALGAYAHQDLPFEKLVEELQPVRDLSRRPIFQVMINSFLEEQPRSLSMPGLQVSALGSEEVSARFELMLRLRETPHGAVCRFEYATDLFEAATIARVAGQFHRLLE